MKTHNHRHIRSAMMLLHFFSVSYDWEPANVMQFKAELRDRFLTELRNRASG